jgi:diguanylate cyclase (GGDEF)-like protein/PAS domain S-box-containing protein
LTGYGHAALLARPLFQLVGAADRASVRRHLARLTSGAANRFSVETRCVTARGAEIWVSLSVSVVRGSARQPAYLVVQMEDIEERKRSEASLKHHAEHDSLTGLYNRRMFESELRRQIKRGHRYGESAALLTLDLDNFKHVNDTYGHKAGDDLLRRVAADLRSRHRTTDTLARLGGDEFAVLALSVTLDQAAALGSVFQAVVARACISVRGRLVGTTASIGVAALDRGVRTASDALAGADGSLYRAKAAHDRGRSGLL